MDSSMSITGARLRQQYANATLRKDLEHMLHHPRAPAMARDTLTGQDAIGFEPLMDEEEAELAERRRWQEWAKYAAEQERQRRVKVKSLPGLYCWDSAIFQSWHRIITGTEWCWRICCRCASLQQDLSRTAPWVPEGWAGGQLVVPEDIEV